MTTKRFSLGLRAAFAILTVTLLVTTTWAAPREKVLHNFNKNTGAYPYGSLIFDAAGNLYGTTTQRGNRTKCHGYGCGLVFELMPQAGGGWKEKMLHRFSGKDGANPAASLIFDSAGNLYGTTSAGGNLTKCSGWGCGTVFELMPKSGGGWTEKVLHNFNNKNGFNPEAGLIFDAAGDLYGTTYGGGDLTKCSGYGCGTVFELMPQAGGGWLEKVLHNFNGKNGANPIGNLIFDAAGNLYGTTASGGDLTKCNGGCGKVFELSPQGGGGWTETVLHSFSGKDGASPQAGLIFDAAGDLYGTTSQGGILCGDAWCGTVFELIPKSGGGWMYKLLYSFTRGTDGGIPSAGLILDAAGDLYGTTVTGGNPKCPQFGCGLVFELSPQAGGGWTEKVLHRFSGKDGAHPFASLIFDAAGNLYGTTVIGGASGTGCGGYRCGTVFEIIR